MLYLNTTDVFLLLVTGSVIFKIKRVNGIFKNFIGDSHSLSRQSTCRQINILRYGDSQYIDCLLLYLTKENCLSDISLSDIFVEKFLKKPLWSLQWAESGRERARWVTEKERMKKLSLNFTSKINAKKEWINIFFCSQERTT